MNLLIKKDSQWQKDPQLFYIFLEDCLIPEIQSYFLNILNPYWVLKWDEYFKSSYNWNIGDYPPNIYNTLMYGAASLKAYDYRDYYTITIKPNQIVPKTTAKLYDICAEINYGNLTTPAYPIFDNSFKYAKNIIKGLFQDYYKTLKGN